MRRMVRTGFRFAILFCIATPAAALAAPADSSAVVEGIVTDATSGRPLAGTLVRVVGSGQQDVTHEGGEFHLTHLPAGTHTVLFERLGYRREVREIEIRENQTVLIRVAMTSSAIELPGIVVTGGTRASLGEHAVRPANVLSGQELTRRLDGTLAATLENEPGLAVSSVGPATARPIIRGLGGDRVLVLEDGARVGDLSSTSSDHALSADPLTAQRIEVVRGPAALLYGSNAIGGVINLIRDEIPSSLPERARGMLSLQAQSVNEGLAGGASVESGWGPLAVRGEASYRRAGDLNTPRGELDNTEMQTYSLSAGVSHVGAYGHGGIAYRYYDNGYGIPGGFVGAHPEGVDVEMRRHSLHGEASLDEVGPFSEIEIDGKYTHYYHRELEANGILGTEFGLLTGSGELMARHDELGPFESGATGVRVSWQDFAAGGESRTTPSKEWSAALFLLEELGLGPVRLQGGARFGWHRIEPLETETNVNIGEVRTRTFGAFSASLGALYSPAEGVGIGASIARAYRTPETGELFSQGPHLAAYSFEVGNPDLDPEVGVGADLFLRISRTRFHGEIAAFRNGLNGYIYYRDTGELSPSGLPIYQATGTDAVLKGFEASAGLEVITHLLLDGSVSYVHGTIVDTDEPLPMIPPLRGRLALRFERPEFFAGAAWRAAARQGRVAEDQFETPTRGYNVLDADVGVRWTAFGRVQSVTVRLDNITSELVHDHLSRIRDRDTNERVPGPGRSASMTYRVVF